MAAQPSATTGDTAFPESLHKVFAEALDAAGGAARTVRLDPVRAAQIQARYAREYAELWSGLLSGSVGPLADRRFAGEGWKDNTFSSYTAALYLLNARALLELAEAVEADAKTRQRIRFAVEQWVDASAPSNVWALNPDAIQAAVKSGGETLRRGMDNLLGDLRRGKITQSDEAQFEVGRNVAVSEGAVVYENRFFQLIDYKPLTDKVHARPLLIVPPCINKFYILDLQPGNSLVRYAVEQGHRVLLVSWRNPDASCATWTWDDYIEHGVLRAIEVACDIAQAARPRGRGASRIEEPINALGFCIGGTLLATSLAVLAARGERPVHSATLLTTLLDFEDTGVLDVFVDEAAVAMREATIGKGGLLTGAELAAVFSSLRANDLTWNYVVGNYLKGETPPPFDLLYWNGDSTNLPGPMLCWYLRNTYLENRLRQPGALQVAGSPVDLRHIDVPAYVYASREDHIVPWASAYASARLLGGDTRFVLGASGHIAGVINPASKGRRSHWRVDDDALPASSHAWLSRAAEHAGSWWPDWADWLKGQGGPLQAAPKEYGAAGYAPIEPAPGRYVKAKS